MPIIQQKDKIVFGTGYLQKFLPGAAGPTNIGILNEISLAMKIAQKGIWGEGGWAVAMADGQRTLDISAKHYNLNLSDIGTDFNGTVAASTQAAAVQEAGVVPGAGPFTATLVNGAAFVAGSLNLVVYVIGSNGKPYPVTYTIVAGGSELAGSAASVSNVGVITFAAGDTGLAFAANYQYTSTVGQSVLLQQTYQDSTPFYGMKLYKRDRSPIDNSVGYLICELFAVRPSDMTIPFKENDFSNYDRKWSAFADPTGNVAKLTFVNAAA
jgi:hypothetical protein